MAEKTKPHLRVVAGRPVTVQQRESKLDAARRRYGKPFAFESGVKFKWTLEPTVLSEWLQRRIWDRHGELVKDALLNLSTSSGKEGHE